jgi:ribosome-binding protein aMBF1 (putative translation factor)
MRCSDVHTRCGELPEEVKSGNLLASRALQIFGRTVRRLRKAHGLSQEELAVRADMHLNHVSSIERGERNLGFLSLLKLARGLDVPATSLLAEFPPDVVKRMRL